MRWMLFLAMLATPAAVSGGEEKPAGFDTPEQAFKAYITGVATEDYDRQLASLTRESQAYHIGLAVFSASFLFGQDPAMQKALREHAPAKEDKPPATGDEQQQFIALMLSYQEPARLMKRLSDRQLELAKQLAGNERPVQEVVRPKVSELIAAVTLEKVLITGDTATARVNIGPAAVEWVVGLPDDIPFRRIAGRWYCDIDPR